MDKNNRDMKNVHKKWRKKDNLKHEYFQSAFLIITLNNYSFFCVMSYEKLTTKL